ncbi:hypothetical protein ANANG_G00091470 [Anguilla anguilla]|uniref:Uncharacterized protein n=1 Tax=Anguilla anguilla TaxID=7936 RepID=A0A9D3MM97_ANGAN|nr:hypothetical protein ANANG_G00091470 [Anguilla anguilla]
MKRDPDSPLTTTQREEAPAATDQTCCRNTVSDTDRVEGHSTYIHTHTHTKRYPTHTTHTHKYRGTLHTHTRV